MTTRFPRHVPIAFRRGHLGTIGSGSRCLALHRETTPDGHQAIVVSIHQDGNELASIKLLAGSAATFARKLRRAFAEVFGSAAHSPPGDEPDAGDEPKGAA